MARGGSWRALFSKCSLVELEQDACGEPENPRHDSLTCPRKASVVGGAPPPRQTKVRQTGQGRDHARSPKRQEGRTTAVAIAAALPRYGENTRKQGEPSTGGW